MVCSFIKNQLDYYTEKNLKEGLNKKCGNGQKTQPNRERYKWENYEITKGLYIGNKIIST